MADAVFITNTELSVNENAGQVFESISRSGSLVGAVTVTYGITGDTAVDGQDFIGGTGTVTIPAGVSRVTVPIQIINDPAPDPTETFVFSLIDAAGASIFAPRTSRVSILDNDTPPPPPNPEPPLTSNYNVTQVPLVAGINQPVRFVFSPLNPSQVYVGEKPGVIALADLGTGQTTTVLDLSSQVNESGDRGLLDIALDPNFAQNGFIYAFMVVDPPGTAANTGAAGPDGIGNRYAQVVRYTANAATGFTTIVPNSAKVLLGGAGQSLADISGGGALDYTDPAFASATASDQFINPNASQPPVVINGFKQDYIKVDSSTHAGGHLNFGPDGALYVSIGDGTSFNYADPRTPNVQLLDSLSGKILRINPATGQGLADNPFVASGVSLDSDRAKVFQLGLRNPFSVTFAPDGRLFIADTGWNSWEEIDSGGPGANFGWPFFEGGDGGVSLQTPTYSDFAAATSFYNAVAAGSITVTAPFRAFSHNSADPGFKVQAITAGEAIYTGTVYPSSLQNDFIFTDFTGENIFAANVNDSSDVKLLYSTNAGVSPVDFVQGADGFIYYADLVNGQIGRLLISDATTPVGAPITAAIGSGPDALVLKISQDAFQGSAQYTVSVDGVQIGGTLTAAALHASGQDDTITVLGTFAAGSHTLTVNFLNDLYAGTATTDRNLYVDGVTFDTAPVANSTAALLSAGPQNFPFISTSTAPPPTPGSATIGSGPDKLVLKISQDAFQGSAQYTVSVDGVQIGGTLTAAALHASGQDDTITVLGTFSAGNHTLTVNFLNDLYAGTATTDRNLYVDGVTFDTAPVANSTAALLSAGPQNFTFSGTGTAPPPTPGSTTIGTGTDKLVLKISQDAFQGSAQYTVSVDGVQIGGTLTAVGLHASGQDDTVTVLGTFAAGNHTLTVNFLNDLYAGTATTDRNLYVDGVTFGTVPVPNGTAALLSAGPQNFTFSGAGTAPPPTPGSTTIGTGADKLALKISQDAFQGSAQYTVSVDGVQIGGTLTAVALHASGQDDTITVLGTFAAGNHTLTVNFLNDLYAGTATTDRNLYVDGVTFDTVPVANGTAALLSAGPQNFTFSGTGTAPPPTLGSTTIGTGADSLVLKISQDAFQGSAQYTVSVDGVQIGGTLTAAGLHGAGQDDTITVKGNFAAGSHTLTVNFLNDLYNGTTATDRNLYLDGATLDGITVPAATVALFSAGPQSIAFVKASAPLALAQPAPPAATVTIAAADANPVVNLSNVTITAASGNHTLLIGGSFDTATLTGGIESVTASQGNNTITTGTANDTLSIGGTGNLVDAGAGTNTVTDSGSGNTIVMPGAGGGFDDVFGNVLQNADILDFRSALAGTAWDGSNATLGNFLRVSMSGTDAVLAIRPTAGGVFSNIAQLHGSGTLDLPGLLAHAAV